MSWSNQIPFLLLGGDILGLKRIALRMKAEPFYKYTNPVSTVILPFHASDSAWRTARIRWSRMVAEPPFPPHYYATYPSVLPNRSVADWCARKSGIMRQSKTQSKTHTIRRH